MILVVAVHKRCVLEPDASELLLLLVALAVVTVEIDDFVDDLGVLPSHPLQFDGT